MSLGAITDFIKGKPGSSVKNIFIKKGEPSGSPNSFSNQTPVVKNLSPPKPLVTFSRSFRRFMASKSNAKILHMSQHMKQAFDHTPHHQKQGWKTSGGNLFYGYYQTQVDYFYGEIIRRGDILEAYIFDPPKRLKHHPKQACFMDRGQGKFFIHLDFQPTDFSPSGIVLKVEKILTESFTFAKGRLY